jgi:hypothetical protein
MRKGETREHVVEKVGIKKVYEAPVKVRQL